MNKRMDERATAVMVGSPEAGDESVFQIVLSYAQAEDQRNGLGTVLRFENADDCGTAFSCMRDAKADVDRTSALTILVWD